MCTGARSPRRCGTAPGVPREHVLAEPGAATPRRRSAGRWASLPAAAREGVVVVLPADHRIGDPAPSAPCSRRPRRRWSGTTVMTLGVVPRWAETGFGYLELGESSPGGERRRRCAASSASREARPRPRPAFVASGRPPLERRHIRLPWRTSSVPWSATSRSSPPGLACGGRAAPSSPTIYPPLPAISSTTGSWSTSTDLAPCRWTAAGATWVPGRRWPRSAARRRRQRVRGDVLVVGCRDNLSWPRRAPCSAWGRGHGRRPLRRRGPGDAEVAVAGPARGGRRLRRAVARSCCDRPAPQAEPCRSTCRARAALRRPLPPWAIRHGFPFFAWISTRISRRLEHSWPAS